jgi:hypothetical protein
MYHISSKYYSISGSFLSVCALNQFLITLGLLKKSQSSEAFDGIL